MQILKIKPELATVIDDKKEKSKSWKAHLSHNDDFHNGTCQCDLISYGDCQEEARENLNVAFNKLFVPITDRPTLAELAAGILPDKNSHDETDWGPDVGLEIVED